MKKDLLFLVHRIPYPPNKGDKIRSYHFLKYLATEFNVFLGTFIDDSNDRQYTDKVDQLCTETFYQDLNPSLAKIKSLQGLLTGEALSLPYYQSSAMQSWVDNAIESHNIKKVLIFSSVMAKFINAAHDVDMIVDFVDVDSDKWRQYAEKKQGIVRWIYQRESKYLLNYEQKLAEKAKRSLFVSEQEAALFKQLSPSATTKIDHINNGVDTEFFSPDLSFPSPYLNGEEALVFTGAMDYWANIDAVCWFGKDIFPQLEKHHPRLKFYIVGGKPSKEVQALAANPNIIVTGRVDDVRPYVAHAKLAVAPLRIARGIQNKVLEAMSMGKPIIATTAAMEGIPYHLSLDIFVADETSTLVKQVNDWLTDHPAPLLSSNNREFVKNQFSWEQNINRLATLLQE